MGFEFIPFFFLGGVAQFLLLFGLGMLLRELAPERLDALEVTVLREPATAGLVGLAALAVGTFLILGAAITIVGIPLAVLLALGIGLSMGVGLVAVARVVGQALPVDGLPTAPTPRLAAGLGTLWLVSLVPVGGALALSCASFVGLGALLRSGFRRLPRTPATRGPADGPYRSAAA